MAYSRKRLIPCVSVRAEGGCPQPYTHLQPAVILGQSSAWTTFYSPFSPASKCSRGVECKGHSALSPADLTARVPSQQRAPTSAWPYSALVCCPRPSVTCCMSTLASSVCCPRPSVTRSVSTLASSVCCPRPSVTSQLRSSGLSSTLILLDFLSHS